MKTQTTAIMTDSAKAAGYDAIMAILNSEPPARMPGEILTDIRESFDMLGAALYTLSLLARDENPSSVSRFKGVSLSVALDMASQYLEDILSDISYLASLCPRIVVCGERG